MTEPFTKSPRSTSIDVTVRGRLGRKTTSATGKVTPISSSSSARSASASSRRSWASDTPCCALDVSTPSLSSAALIASASANALRAVSSCSWAASTRACSASWAAITAWFAWSTPSSANSARCTASIACNSELEGRSAFASSSVSWARTIWSSNFWRAWASRVCWTSDGGFSRSDSLSFAFASVVRADSTACSAALIWACSPSFSPRGSYPASSYMASMASSVAEPYKRSGWTARKPRRASDTSSCNTSSPSRPGLNSRNVGKSPSSTKTGRPLTSMMTSPSLTLVSISGTRPVTTRAEPSPRAESSSRSIAPSNSASPLTTTSFDSAVASTGTAISDASGAATTARASSGDSSCWPST